MNGARLVLSVCVGSAASLLGCRSPTEITVVVDTTLDCSAITSTAIAVGSKDALVSKSAAATTLHCDGGHIGALVIVPSGDAQDEVAIRVVSGLKGQTAEACTQADYAGGCVVARRSLHFVPHTSLRVPIQMEPACVDVACDAPGTFATCVNGACVSAVIPDPGACVGDGCGEGVLGDAGIGGKDAGSDATVTGDAGDAGDADAPDAEDDGSTDGAIESGPHVPTWVPMASSASIGFAARTKAQAVWTGSRMLVWGGELATSFGSDGASYDPVADTWELLPPSQLGGRPANTVLWSGTEMIVWGGAPNTINAGRYNPTTGTWRILPDPPIEVRDAFGAVWATTTGEMLVWGGDDNLNYLADGAAYSPTRPAGSEWRVLEPSPLSARSSVRATWNGTSMVIFGGAGCGGECDDAASYDPVTKAWTVITNVPTILDARLPETALATGPTLTFSTFFGNAYDGDLKTTGATYNAATNQWSNIDGLGTSVLAEPARDGAGFFWGAGKLWMWGGYGGGVATDTRGDGAYFDPAGSGGGTWAAIPPGGPSARGDMVVVWTGTEAIFWSGADSAGTVLDDGKRLRP